MSWIGLTHFRHAARGLVKAPMFTAAAALSLAIGIGANVSIFTAANALLLAPPTGVPEPDRLLDIGRLDRGNFDTVSYRTYEGLRDTTDVFSGVYAVNVEPRAMSLGATEGAERVYAQIVSASFFDVIGVTPGQGAFFHADEEHVGTPLRKVVLTDAFWRRRFSADPTIVGGGVILNGETFIVVGVARPDFRGTTILSPDLWVPLTGTAQGLPSVELMTSRQSVWLTMGGRLKPGVSIETARQSLDALASRLRADDPEVYRNFGLTALPSSRLPGAAAQFVGIFLSILMGLAGLVLLVTCINLAGLLLARSASRTREIAVRLALGASRRSLISMLLAESLLLFGVASVASLLLARVTTNILERVVSIVPVPIAIDLAIDWRVLLFTLVLGLAASVLTGMIPALQSTRPAVMKDLKADASAPKRRRLRNVFVAAQIAFCFVLIAMAGLFLQALGVASTVETGMVIDDVDVAVLDLDLGGYPEARWPGAADEIRDRLAAVPGVTSAAVARVVPLEGNGFSLGGLRRLGDTRPEDIIGADWNTVSPEYFATVGIPLSAGRNFTRDDRDGAPRVAIVNEYFARRTWPGEDPIGRVLEFGSFRPSDIASLERLTVVGVAKDSKYRWIGDESRYFVYVPYAQHAMSDVRVFLRRDATLRTPGALQQPVRLALREFNRNLPMIGFASLQSYADLGLIPQRVAAALGGALGTIALLLAAIGIYSLTAQAVANRTREFGVRIALGADPARIRRLVLGQGLRLTAIGGAIGLILAVGAGQLVQSLLFGLSPFDPASLGLTVLVLAIVAVAAGLKPARRAARMDPVIALRAE